MSEEEDVILRRILNEIGIPDLVERFVQLPGTDLQSLLIRIMAEYVRRRPLSDINRAADRKDFFGPSPFDQRELRRLDGLCYQATPKAFQAVVLSPVSPLGLNAALTRVSQNNVLSGTRGMETVADPTTALCLEASRRRKKLCAKNPRNRSLVDLCTSHRTLRLQPFDRASGFMQHFGVFALCTAGRNTAGAEAFTVEHATRHLRIYLDLIRRMNHEGFDCRDVVVFISDIRVIEQLMTKAGADRATMMRHVMDPTFKPLAFLKADLPSRILSVKPEVEKLKEYGLDTQATLLSVLEDRLLAPLAREYPEVRMGIDLNRMAGLGYYRDFCFRVIATTREGKEFPLADGGASDWIERLLSDKKECLLTSGFGTELAYRFFRAE